jgi:hypothetical protein
MSRRIPLFVLAGFALFTAIVIATSICYSMQFIYLAPVRWDRPPLIEPFSLLISKGCIIYEPSSWGSGPPIEKPIFILDFPASKSIVVPTVVRDNPWWHLGFNYSRAPFADCLQIPFWPLLATLIAGLFIQIRRRLRKWQMDGVFCKTCGYDLRASNERCPECGKPFLHELVKSITQAENPRAVQ